MTYVLFPAVPPWLAAVDGYIEPVQRVIAGMWATTGVAPAKALFENHGEFYNQEAAIPSLHAASRCSCCCSSGARGGGRGPV